MVYVNEKKTFNNCGILYTVEKVLKSDTQRVYLQKRRLKLSQLKF